MSGIPTRTNAPRRGIPVRSSSTVGPPSAQSSHASMYKKTTTTTTIIQGPQAGGSGRPMTASTAGRTPMATPGGSMRGMRPPSGSNLAGATPSGPPPGAPPGVCPAAASARTPAPGRTPASGLRPPSNIGRPQQSGLPRPSSAIPTLGALTPGVSRLQTPRPRTGMAARPSQGSATPRPTTTPGVTQKSSMSRTTTTSRMGPSTSRTVMQETKTVSQTKTPAASRTPAPGAPGGARPRTCPGGQKLPPLERELQSTLMEASAQKPKVPLKATGGRRTMISSTPMVMTQQGPVQATAQVTSTKSVRKTPGMPDVVSREIIAVKEVAPGQAEKTEVAVQRLIPPAKKGRGGPQQREILTVTSSVTVAPGVKQTARRLVYEGDPKSLKKPKAGKPKPSPAQVAQMVAEETALINETLALAMPEVKRVSPCNYPVRKMAESYAIDQQAIAALEQSVSVSGGLKVLDSEDPPPEMIANLMNTEERGLNMGASPANVYNYLFTDTRVEPVIEVTSVAPAPLEDVVVPTQKPKSPQQIAKQQEATLNLITEVKPVEEAYETTYCQVVGDAPVAGKNTARKGKSKKKRVTLLMQETPPWALQDVESIVDVVGGPLAESRVIAEQSMAEPDPFTEGIEYVLQMEAPTHFSQVQLRGSQHPPWFPGYLMALPDNPNLISVAKSPSAVFNAAWKATQPDIFDDHSLFVL